jgi:putative transposase
MLTIAYNASRAKATCERFLGSVRRECLDQLLILHEQQLQRVLKASAQSFNRARPHQGIRRAVASARSAGSVLPDDAGGKINSFPVLGGLHHDDRRRA